MDALPTVVGYHERTKHYVNRYAASLGYLDWATQPDPFRRFEGAPLTRLVLSGTESAGPAYDELFEPGCIAAQPVTLETLSALFEFSLALSAWKEYGDSRWALRINPSSGNLHPTEGYLVIGPVTGLAEAPGVYHYAPKEHGLERRAEISADAWHKFVGGFPTGTFLIGLTSIHWREAWKYGERAYRYCQHDAGHAMAAVSLAAAMQGWTALYLEGAGDAQISALLGLDRAGEFPVEVEREHPDMLLAIVPSYGTFNHHALVEDQCHTPLVGNLCHTVLGESFKASRWFGVANRLSRDHVDWDIIDAVAAASEKPVPDSMGNRKELPCGPPLVRGDDPSVAPVLSRNSSSASARQIIFQRRSAVALDGVTAITADQLYLILDRVMPRFDRPPWNTLGPPVCVHLALFVHLVEGLPPGLYFLVRAPQRRDELQAATRSDFRWEKPPGCPEHLPLFFLLPGDARRAAGQVSCGQSIAAMGAFSCGMIAEFGPRLVEHGPWFYRRLFWETGVIGQMLYLEAEAAGIRGTGIGCFFDDAVHSLFGFGDSRFQSLYHFTMGGPVEDARLRTGAPYAGEEAT